MSLRQLFILKFLFYNIVCLLYTSDAADERSSVDLGGRRIIKKQNKKTVHNAMNSKTKNTNKNKDTV